MSALIALVKTKLSPSQSPIHKQEVVDRILAFAQSLFMKHAHCDHLGDLGMGVFAAQVGATVNLHPRVFELTQLRPRVFPPVPRWRHSLRRVSMQIWCSRLRLGSRYVGLSKGYSG
jgi:metal-dependent hydrolase (beta-lactamase superfamily II)